MTPALKAMVEAMGREFLRQTEESDEAPVCQFETQALRVTDVYGGRFDLEKVARAGLEAIKVPDDAILATMRATMPADGHEWEFVEEDAEDHWASMIDTILGEKP